LPRVIYFTSQRPPPPPPPHSPPDLAIQCSLVFFPSLSQLHFFFPSSYFLQSPINTVSSSDPMATATQFPQLPQFSPRDVPLPSRAKRQSPVFFFLPPVGYLFRPTPLTLIPKGRPLPPNALNFFPSNILLSPLAPFFSLAVLSFPLSVFHFFP